jgi:hypothetical protein
LYESSQSSTSVRKAAVHVYWHVASRLEQEQGYMNYQPPDERTILAIIEYLAGEGLIKLWPLRTPQYPDTYKNYFFSITHKGIKEVEQTKENPRTPSPHFPANIYYKIEGNYIERDRIVGDRFENISNATIINKALVEGSFNKAKKEYGDEVSNALIQIAEFIQKSTDPAAASLLDDFNQELNKPRPDKSRLKGIWSGIERVLPSIETIAETVARIGPLFKD